MDNKFESNMPLSGRNFGHCIVTWEIQNYGRALWKKHLEIETPEFSVKEPVSKDTKWKLILQTVSDDEILPKTLSANLKCNSETANLNPEPREFPKMDFKAHLSKNDKENFDALCLRENESEDVKLSVKKLMLYLERGCSDEGPDRVFVDWKVYYKGIKGEEIFLVHDEHIFSKNIKYGFNIGILYDFDRDFEYNSGLTTIFCHMIVKDINSRRKFNSEMSLDLYGLSNDLQGIFNRQELCDVEIIADGKKVKVHKAVMCSHSEFFKRGIEKGSNSFELAHMEYNEVLKILMYMYSHDVADVIGKPSVSVYDAAIQMGLSDLVAHYAPDKVKINTKIDVKILTQPWVITDFTKKIDCISSPFLKNNHNDTAWQIHLFPKGIDGKSEYIALSVDCIDGVVFDDLSIQCAVLRENENLNLWKKLEKAGENVVRDTEFILREDVYKLLNNDTLRLGFKVKTSSGKESSITNVQCTPVLYSMEKSFENMRGNMLYLRQSNKYTDVTFEFGKKEIKAHKFILSARSPMFGRKFEETYNRIPLMNMSAEIFEILLDYIYCAKFNVSDINTAFEVYKSAEELLIPGLQVRCSKFLQNNIKIDSAIRIVMLAKEYNDKYLIDTAEEFIRTNKSAYTRRRKQTQKLEIVTQKKDDTVTETCIAKCIAVMKLNKIPIESYDLEIAARPLNSSDSDNEENGTSSDNTAERENVSDETIVQRLEDGCGNEETKSLAETPSLIVYYLIYSNNSEQSDKLSVPPKKRSDGRNISKIIAENKVTGCIHIDIKSKETRKNNPSDKDVEKDISKPASHTKVPDQSKQKADPSTLLQSMQSCLQNLQECQKELDAEIAKKELDRSRQDEQKGSSLKSNTGHNVSLEKGSKQDAPSVLGDNEQESLNKEVGKNFKSIVGKNELEKGFKLDTTLKEFHGNGQEFLDKQNGNEIQSTMAHETDSALN